MKYRSLHSLALSVTAACLTLASALAFADGVALQKGDVLAAVGSGKVKHFSPTGTLLDTLDTTTGSANTTGMCFDASGNLYVTSFQAAKVSKFDANGNLVQGNFGSGFNASPESCVVSSGNSVYVGQADGSRDILKFDTAGTAQGNFDVPTGDRGTDWIDLAADQCTMFYTSEDNTVRRYNVCTNAALPNFATGLPEPCYALRIRPNGEVMVGCQSSVVRLDSTGATIGTYPGSTYGLSSIFAMNLDPDGVTFWTGDLTSTGPVARINIETGAKVTGFNTDAQTQLAGLAIVGEIRASGGGGEVVRVVPTLDAAGLALLALLLVGAGSLALRRRA